nr:type VII secretion protein EccB [Propionicimonas sp.]
MASNKDILEAQRYNRRRLVTAFMSGTPGGRELESKALGRPVLIGTALGLVLMIVAVVMGRFSPALPAGWENGTLVAVRGTGARYFTVEGVLHPIANVTSARLLVAAGGLKTAEVDASALAGIRRGSAIGITGAPDMVPSRDDLRSGSWTACGTPSDDTHTWVGSAPSRLVDAATALVSNGGRTWLVTGGQRYPLSTDGIRTALGLDTAAVHKVSGAWLDLFESGTEVRPLRIPDAGQPAGNLPARLQTAVIGSLIEVEKGAAQRRYVISGPGRITPLSDFAYPLYQMGTGVDFGNPLNATVAEISGLEVRTEGVVPTDWPASVGDAVGDEHRVCARLGEDDGTPTTALAALPATQGVGDAAGVEVAGGSGALVRATSGGTLGAVSLVTDPGLAYGIGGTPAETLARLQYTEADVHTVPAAWVALVPAGVTLSPEAAQQTVKA